MRRKRTEGRLGVMPDLAGPDDGGLAEVGDVGGEVPVEVLALQPLTQFHAAAHVTVGSNILLLERPALLSRDGQRYSKMYRLKRYRYAIFEKKIV